MTKEARYHGVVHTSIEFAGIQHLTEAHVKMKHVEHHVHYLR